MASVRLKQKHKKESLKQSRKKLEREKNSLIASLNSFVDPMLREAALIQHNTRVSSSSSSSPNEDGHLLSELNFRSEVCRHFREALEWHESVDDDDGDSAPSNDSHLDWLREEHISEGPDDGMSVLSQGSKPAEEMNKHIWPRASFRRRSRTDITCTPPEGEDREIYTQGKDVTPEASPEQFQIFKSKIHCEKELRFINSDGRTLNPPDEIMEVATLSGSDQEDLVVLADTVQVHREAQGDTDEKKGLALGDIEISQLKKESPLNVAIEQDDLGKNSLQRKEKNSRVLGWLEDCKMYFYITPIVLRNGEYQVEESKQPKDSTADLFTRKSVSKLKDEKSLGRSFEEDGPYASRHLEISPKSKVIHSKVSKIDKALLPGSLKPKRVSWLSEENPSGTSFEEKVSVASRTMSSNSKSSHSPTGLLRNKPSSRLIAKSQPGIFHGQTEYLNPTGNSLKSKDSPKAGVLIFPDRSPQTSLRNMQISWLSEENPSGKSPSVTSRDLSPRSKSSLSRKSNSLEDSPPGDGIRNKRKLWLSEENPSGISTGERDSVTSRDLFPKPRSDQSRELNFAEHSPAALLNISRKSLQRECNPSEVSKNEKSVTTINDSLLHKEPHSKVFKLLDDLVTHLKSNKHIRVSRMKAIK